MHGKERAIGPALMRVLPLAGVQVIDQVETDRFGTFTGEVGRPLEPLQACMAKARHGAEVGGLDLVIASEGSFFPYPPAPFMPCDEEVLVLYDKRDERFFEHRYTSLRTVFGGEVCSDRLQLLDFARRMQFPAHGLVVRPREQWRSGNEQVKGITSEGALLGIAERLISNHGSCWVETDMRAMMNPTRMEVIGETAERFAGELSEPCPACGACWFRVSKAMPGLPCAMCGWPTPATRAYVRSCWACGHSSTSPRPDGRATESPQHCGNCNP